jgi:hypothetical protein
MGFSICFNSGNVICNGCDSLMKTHVDCLLNKSVTSINIVNKECYSIAKKFLIGKDFLFGYYNPETGKITRPRLCCEDDCDDD